MPPAANTTAPDAKPAENWIYIGRRAVGKKLYYCYLKADGDTASYVKPITVSKVIGGLYAVRQTADGKSALISKDGRSYLGPSGHGETTVWRVQDETAMALREAQKMAEAEEAGESVFLDMTVRDLKKQVAFLPAFKRRAVVATVIEIIYGRSIL